MINIVNPGLEHPLRISIDNHHFWIVANDGGFIEPQKVQVSSKFPCSNVVRAVNKVANGMCAGRDFDKCRARDHPDQTGPGTAGLRYQVSRAEPTAIFTRLCYSAVPGKSALPSIVAASSNS